MAASKILVIAPFPTDPLDAGNRARVVNLIEALKNAGNDVHFAHVHTGDYDEEAMRRRFGADKLHLLPYLKQPPDERWFMRWVREKARRLGIDRGYTWSVDSWYADWFTPLLAQLQQQHRFNAVVVTYVFMSKAFEAFPKPCLRVLDTHDSMGNRHRGYQRAGMRPEWFSTTPKDEEKGLRRADVVLAIQESEAIDFRGRLGAADRPRILTVGHLVDLPALKTLSDRRTALFMGSHNPINIHALEHFLAHVHPLIREAVPDFELLVAGPVAHKVADQSGLLKLGYVDDLGPVFRSAMLFVSPVLLGTGVAIKLLDAMANGLPCVSTASGARGLDQAGDALDVVADDDPALFATRTIALLTDPAWRRVRSVAARAAAERWNKTQLEALSTLLDEIGEREEG